MKQSFESKVVDLAKQMPSLGMLHQDQIKELYHIVVCENEAWDGEPVEVGFVVRRMIRRFQQVGLIPSRN